MPVESYEHRTQTPAQWAVRWHGIALVGLLLLSVPVCHLVWHGVLGRAAPALVTRSQTERPVASWDQVADGSWMIDLDRHLREASPVVWGLRGNWNELLLRAGVLQSDQVFLGRDRWMFHRTTLREQLPRLLREAGARRRFFASVRDLVQQAGAELVVSLIPDKVRVYPEFAFADGKLPTGKEPVYGRTLQELRDLDIVVVDVAAALAAARSVMPNEQLFYSRDTHWRPQGALAAGQANALTVESLPAAAALAPRRPGELGAQTQVTSLGDLVGLLGLLTCEQPFVAGRTRTHPLSLFSTELLEQREYYPVFLRAEGQKLNPVVDDPGAEVWLLGTSFSEANGAAALALSLGRPVRAVIDYGASGLGPLRQVVGELRQGVAAKVIVWEIVERGLFAVDWENVKL